MATQNLQQEHRQKKSNYLLKTLIGLAIMLLFWLLPPFAQLTPAGMKMLGLFIMVIYFCICNEFAWPSIFAVVAMSFLVMDIYPNTAGNALYRAVELSWGFNVIIFVIASLFITYALSEVGYMSRVANWLLRQRIARKSPWAFTFAIWFVALFLGMWFDPTATLVFTLGFTKAIFEKLGFQKGEKYPAMVVIGIAFSICIAFGMTPISHPLPILALGVYQNITGASINFVTYMALGIPVGLVCFVGLLAILRFMVKPDMKKLEDADLGSLVEQNPAPMKKREALTAGVAFVVFGCWLLMGFLNVFAAGSAIAGFFNRITTLMPAIMGVVLLCMIRVDGAPLMPFEKGMRNGISWNIIVLLAALFMLGNGLAEATTGFNASIASFMRPFIGSGISSFAIMLLIMLVIILLTNVLNNIPVVMLMLSVCVPMAAELGMHPLSIALLITISGEMAFATPSAFPAITMIYGDEWTQPKLIFRCGVIVMLWCLLIMAAVGYPLARLMFG